MERNKMVIRGSFKGISGDLVQNIVTIIISLVIYLVCMGYKTNLVNKHDIKGSFIEYLLKFDDLAVVSALAFIYLVIILVAIIIIANTIKTLGLFYNLLRIVTFDYSNGRIVDQHLSFPLNRTIDENKFNEVININIEQSFFQRIFNTGTLYIEYLTYTTIDSQLRHLEIPNVARPFQQKNKIL